MVADCRRELDVKLCPVPTGFCYIGWILDGRVSANVDGMCMSYSKTAHISGQIHRHSIEVHYQGCLLHVLAEMTATGLYALVGKSADKYSGKTIKLDDTFLRWAVSDTGATTHARPSLKAVLERIQDSLFRKLQTPFAVPAYVEQAAGMIEADPDGMIAGQVATQLDISPRQLSRVFKRYIGVSPHYFRRIMQIQRAIELVTEGDQSTLTQICLDCGFYDQAHFIHVFNQFFLTSPKAFFDSPDPTLLSFLSRQYFEN